MPMKRGEESLTRFTEERRYDMTIIYIITSLAFGFIAGLLFECFMNSETIHRQNDHIRRLNMEIILLKKAVKNAAKHEVIEIVDNRTNNNEVKFGGF